MPHNEHDPGIGFIDCRVMIEDVDRTGAPLQPFTTSHVTVYCFYVDHGHPPVHIIRMNRTWQGSLGFVHVVPGHGELVCTNVKAFARMCRKHACALMRRLRLKEFDAVLRTHCVLASAHIHCGSISLRLEIPGERIHPPAHQLCTNIVARADILAGILSFVPVVAVRPWFDNGIA
jgi:hypothetical protein